jgi:hypothetical protein
MRTVRVAGTLDVGTLAVAGGLVGSRGVGSSGVGAPVVGSSAAAVVEKREVRSGVNTVVAELLLVREPN